MLRLVQTRPVQYGPAKRLLRTRIGDSTIILGVEEPRKLLAATPGDEQREIRREVAEEREGGLGTSLLPHKEHRYLGCEQIDLCRGAHRLGRRELPDSLPESPVADLMVVLNERYEGT